ncbi:MAG: TlpA disulfide reductase family protein [Bacteroidetes bacterium]|jgi:thiol-disulfide isomerase/thioredoxin|nr:TlpA disulfide reductase family protein [Bacteroidota bacterium]
MKQYILIVYSLFLLPIVISCQKHQKESTLELNGKSELRINNQSKDSIQVSISNWVYLPMYEEKIDTLVAPSQSIELPISTQTRHYYNLNIGENQYRIFAMIGNTIEVSVSGENRQMSFAGELSEINEFLKTRNINSDWQPRSPWYQGRGSISDLLLAYDSITNAQKNELKTCKNLPSWYREFENSRLDYVNAESKLSALGYRKKMLSISETVPNNYLNQVVRDLSIERLDFVGETAYMRFIGWYINYKNDPLLEDDIPNSKEQWISFTERGIASVDENFENQRIKEVILARRFTDIIDRRRHIWDDNWLQYIKNPELSSLIDQQLLANPVLPEGNKTPYFYLSDLDSTFYEPNDFKGKILLINFWATWCKPCYQEFEHENRLVDRFQNESVAIVNICIESEMEKWKEVVNKYALKTKNLFATKNWSEKINSDFGTTALPHSVLIDWNGNVIQNKCPRPSAGVGDLIRNGLNEMKKETDR